jgi:hypothetical protein
MEPCTVAARGDIRYGSVESVNEWVVTTILYEGLLDQTFISYMNPFYKTKVASLANLLL